MSAPRLAPRLGMLVSLLATLSVAYAASRQVGQRHRAELEQLQKVAQATASGE